MTDGPATGAMDPERWRLVNRVLNQALELATGPARQSFLDTTCRQDPALRAEVDSLIAAAEQSAWLDKPPVVKTADTELMTGNAGFRHAPLTSGQQFGPYRIVGKLGEGGMGVVYHAVDTRLDRRVALKLLLADDSAASHKTRFAREARAASALNHPNIATIYEFDNFQGTDFIAMEYVEGLSLHDILVQHLAPLEKLLDYARQVALAAGAAHAAGIVHRDLKPSNVMVTKEGIVKVLDFGLAKLASQSSRYSDATETMPLTKIGGIIGTPSYMSPEQVAGEPVDHRTDIFAFGIILYEMVCGERPFRGPNPLSTLHLIATAEPRSVVEFNARVPPKLVALIDRCLKKKKAERLQSMAEAASELSKLSEPVPDRRSVLGRRSRTSTIAMLLVAGALGLAGGTYWLSRTPQTTVPAAAERGINCFIQVQRKVNGTPVGQPHLATVRDTFPTASRFRFLAEPQQPGHLYVISDGPDESGVDRLYLLYPTAGTGDTPLSARQPAETPWYGFEPNPGTQRLWVIWAEQPVSELKPEGTGLVDEPARANRIRGLLSQFHATDQGTTGGIELRGNAKVLGTVVELRHS